MQFDIFLITAIIMNLSGQRVLTSDSVIDVNVAWYESLYNLPTHVAINLAHLPHIINLNLKLVGFD